MNQPDPWPKLPMQEQPDPKPNNLPAVWGEVIRDMQARDTLGRERYGVPLQPANGRNALLDAYEESLDKTAYLKSALIEREMLRGLIEEALDSAMHGDSDVAALLLARALELLPVGRGE